MKKGRRTHALWPAFQDAPASPQHPHEARPAAALICLIGFFLYLLLAEPVLNIIGINYGSEEAGALGRMHPGSYFILLSFVVLIFGKRNPIDQIVHIARRQTAFFTLFAIYIVILIYWMLRGPKGIGLIIDIHILMPICAIVFCYAPLPWYRPIVYSFTGVAVLNALIGIGESITRLRIFPFDPDWEVLSQEYFRASALMGHPLNNAVLTAVSIFILLSLRMPTLLKSFLLVILLCALVAFGGRAALVVGVGGLIIYGMIETWRYFTAGGLTVQRMIAGSLALLLVPTLCLAMLYGAVHSDMGERLLAYSSLEDDSADVRVSSLSALEHLSPTDMIFGMDEEKISAVGEEIGVVAPTSDIENPWVLMFMSLGAIMFTIWLAGLGAFVWRLINGAPLALKIGIIAYFCIASTSNSFGRKEPMFVLLAGIAVCVKQLKELEQTEQGRNLSLTDFALD